MTRQPCKLACLLAQPAKQDRRSTHTIERHGGPYSLERLELDDGSLSYEVMLLGPDEYRCVCVVHEDPACPGQALTDARLIVEALNASAKGLRPW